MNFGQMPGPLCPLEQGYTPIGQLDFADGIVRFEIMLIRLKIFIHSSQYVTVCDLHICYNVCDVTGDQNHLLAGPTVKPS